MFLIRFSQLIEHRSNELGINKGICSLKSYFKIRCCNECNARWFSDILSGMNAHGLLFRNVAPKSYM